MSSNATSVSDRATFPGYKGEFSTRLEFIYPENLPQISCYRVRLELFQCELCFIFFKVLNNQKKVMNRKGVILDESQDPKVIFKNSKINTILNWLAC